MSVRRPGLPERDFGVGSEPSSVKRTVAGLMPGVIFTVTDSTKSPGLGEMSMSGLPSAWASQLAAISDVPGVAVLHERLHRGGFERAALQERQQRGTPDGATFILQQRAQHIGRRDLAQRLPCRVVGHAIVLLSPASSQICGTSWRWRA